MFILPDRQYGRELMKHTILPVWLTLAVALTTVAGAAHAGPVDDAVAYCRSTGDDNMINAVPPEILEQAARLLGVTLVPDEKPRAVWRCMDGKVTVCIAGGARFCGRADTQVVPSPDARKFCHDDPNAVDIPTWATGRDTIFGWRCEGPEPIIVGAVRSVDKRGFVKEYWRSYDPAAPAGGDK